MITNVQQQNFLSIVPEVVPMVDVMVINGGPSLFDPSYSEKRIVTLCENCFEASDDNNIVYSWGKDQHWHNSGGKCSKCLKTFLGTASAITRREEQKATATKNAIRKMKEMHPEAIISRSMCLSCAKTSYHAKTIAGDVPIICGCNWRTHLEG